MSKLKWDQINERKYETGVDRGVLFVQDDVTGLWPVGVPWNGLVSVSEKPSGAESNPKYANNKKYLDLTSLEEYACTIEAFTYPDEFGDCDGTAEIIPGVRVGQQRRKGFAFAFRTLVGNDVLGEDFGYKITLVWGAKAKPSEKSHSTVNESPEAMTLSWEVTTTPVDIEGYKPTASMTIDSTTLDTAKLAKLVLLEDMLYGTDGAPGTEAKMPTPDEVVALFEAA